MVRRAPYIRGRGNVAPPTGYRPGLKARWLHPRPLHPRPEPDTMPFTLITYPFVVTDPGIISPADNGLLLASLPTGPYIETDLLITTELDENGSFQLLYGPDAVTFGAQLLFARVTTGTPLTPPEARPLNPSSSLGTFNQGNARSPCIIQPSQLLYIGFYPDATPPTTGAGFVLLKVYS